MKRQEGTTIMEVDAVGSPRGPASRQAGFYNPAMALDRDLCVLMCEYIAGQGCRRFIDGLGATGIRGLRIAKEVDGRLDVTVNDVNPASYERIRRNAARNHVDVTARNEDIRVLLCRERYDYVDIDPYGSPVPFVPAALDGLFRSGYAAFTATDKATLCGVHPQACRRRYDAVPMRDPAMKELGLRILIGFVVRIAARRDYGAVPVFAYSHDHYFRIYLRLEKGARRGNEALQNVGWAWRSDGWHMKSFEEARGEQWAGPLWTGFLLQEDAVAAMQQVLPDKTLAASREARRLLETIRQEVDAPPLYYEQGDICHRYGLRQPPMESIIAALRNDGHRAVRTHFSQDGIKTDAPESSLVAVMRRLQ